MIIFIIKMFHAVFFYLILHLIYNITLQYI